MGNILWSVQLLNPSDFAWGSSARQQAIINTFYDAARDWLGYFMTPNSSTVTIDIQIRLEQQSVAASATYSPVTKWINNQLVYYPSSLEEINVGYDVNGADPEIIVTLDPDHLNASLFDNDMTDLNYNETWYIDYDGFYGVESFATYTRNYVVDFYTMALHEIGHGLGIVQGQDGRIEWFDLFLDSSSHFTGSRSNQWLGGFGISPVQFEGGHIVPGTLPWNDIMDDQLERYEELGYGRGEFGREFLSNFERLMLEDIGYTPRYATNGADTLFGFDEVVDTMNGHDGDDVIDGLSGDDTLYGDGGADKLIGGQGYDYLSGGLGSDLFSVHAQSETDRVVDYQDGIDKLDFSMTDVVSFDQLSINQSGSAVVVTSYVVPGLQVIVDGISVWQLSSTDFIF